MFSIKANIFFRHISFELWYTPRIFRIPVSYKLIKCWRFATENNDLTFGIVYLKSFLMMVINYIVGLGKWQSYFMTIKSCLAFYLL